MLASQISSAPQLGQLYAFILSPSSPQSSLKPEVSQSPPSADASLFLCSLFLFGLFSPLPAALPQLFSSFSA